MAVTVPFLCLMLLVRGRNKVLAVAAKVNLRQTRIPKSRYPSNAQRTNSTFVLQRLTGYQGDQTNVRMHSWGYAWDDIDIRTKHPEMPLRDAL